MTGWLGIGAPKGTPAEIIERLNREVNAGLADPKVKARITDLGSERFWLARRLWQIHRRRNREVGQGGPDGGPQGGLIQALSDIP